MFKRKNGHYFPKRETNNKLVLRRNGNNIFDAKTDNNDNNNNNSFTMVEPTLFEKRINSIDNNIIKMINYYSSRYNNSNFHKRKKDYSYFNPNPNTEEIPTFIYENDLNVNSYKQHIDQKKQYLEKNYSCYMNYMTKNNVEINNQRKTPLISPYSLYMKKIEEVKKYKDPDSSKIIKYNDNVNDSNNNNMNYLNNNDNINNTENNDNNNSNLNTNLNNNINNNINNNNNNLIWSYDSFNNKNYFNRNHKNSFCSSSKCIFSHNNSNYKKIENIEKNMPISNSFRNLNYYGKKNEISNPELFFKKADINFYKYRNELKRFDDYNSNIALNKSRRRFVKKEPDINPYNPQLNSYRIGKSSLSHNIILKPEDFCGYQNNI